MLSDPARKPEGTLPPVSLPSWIIRQSRSLPASVQLLDRCVPVELVFCELVRRTNQLVSPSLSTGVAEVLSGGFVTFVSCLGWHRLILGHWDL